MSCLFRLILLVLFGLRHEDILRSYCYWSDQLDIEMFLQDQLNRYDFTDITRCIRPALKGRSVSCSSDVPLQKVLRAGLK